MGNILNSTMARTSTRGSENLAITNPKRFKPPNKPKKNGGAAGPFIGRTLDFTYAQTAYGTTTSLLSSVALNGLSHTVGSDAAGNQTSYFVTRSYSPRNLLAQVQDIDPETQQTHTLGYGFDGRNVRVERTESPSNGPGTSVHRFFIYAPELSLLAATRDDGTNIWGGNPPSTFARNIDYEIVWFAGRPVAQIAPDPTSPVRRYTFADHLGTPLLQTDTNRNVAWRVEYEPFGNVYEVRAGDRTDQPLRFPGQELAMTFEGPEEGYNVFRWYDSAWGRYTQADPIGLDGGLNAFSYANENPQIFIDVLGLVCDIYVWNEDLTYDWSPQNWRSAFKHAWGHQWLEYPGGSAGFWPTTRPTNPVSGGPGMVQSPDPNSKVSHRGFTKAETYFQQTPHRCPNCDKTATCIANFARTYTCEYSLGLNNCRDFVDQALTACGLTTESPTDYWSRHK